ncbi:MAG: hypothetical protein EZS28_046898, partial [Streblomastix strix]
QGFKVYWNELTEQVHIFRHGKVLAIAKEDGIFRAHTDVRLDADFWGFESKEDMALWNAAILAEAAVARAEIKRKRENEARQKQLENQASASLQDQFYAKRRRVAKFNTTEDMKVAQDIRATFEGIMKVDAEKADMLNYYLNQIQREKLFEEISWGGANVIFPVPKVEPMLPEEKRGLAKSALESAVAVNQGVASLIEDITRKNTNKLVGKMFKVWEASLVSVGDAQTERESRLKGVYTEAQTEDVLSQSSKERFERRKTGKRITTQNQYKCRGRFSRFNSGTFKGIQDDQRVIDFKGRGKFGRGNRKKNFDCVQTNVNQVEKFSS